MSEREDWNSRVSNECMKGNEWGREGLPAKDAKKRERLLPLRERELERHGDGRGGTHSIFRRDQNRDLKSKEEKIDWRSRLRCTMKEGEPMRSSRRDRNRDLELKEEKIERRLGSDLSAKHAKGEIRQRIKGRQRI